MTAPQPVFDHLLHLSDRRGTFEHAVLTEPERSGGYCTDDMARLLVVATRQPDPSGAVNGLAGLAVRFLNDAQSHAGTCRNRMDGKGNWIDEPTLQDWWGRCLWALGTAAAHSSVGLVRRIAVIQFERAAKVRSPYPQAMAHAALGAAEILSVEPDHAIARALLTAYADGAIESADASAVVAEAMIAAGAALERPELCSGGLDMLGSLLEGGGRQPIEVAALADACARAAGVDASPRWPDGVRAAVSWFEGTNESSKPMWDPQTGGGFDELRSDGVSPNQGAAATLAALATMQNAQRLSTVPE
ncbi:glycosyltransferase [Mycolicibacterium sp. 050158]|uniref:glycosyltransferase n=1 Tax=Mycolicibacterium sp. 050158 TaxID=3090602 RepID=UPI00299D5B1D|nr:glycosyltransferase [Mycolicibacterium sp. 050158]MDX1888098.1 glycosyltransferase [Mycolicibacterium sp. 050158]